MRLSKQAVRAGTAQTQQDGIGAMGLGKKTPTRPSEEGSAQVIQIEERFRVNPARLAGCAVVQKFVACGGTLPRKRPDAARKPNPVVRGAHLKPNLATRLDGLGDGQFRLHGLGVDMWGRRRRANDDGRVGIGFRMRHNKCPRLFEQGRYLLMAARLRVAVHVQGFAVPRPNFLGLVRWLASQVQDHGAVSARLVRHVGVEANKAGPPAKNPFGTKVLQQGEGEVRRATPGRPVRVVEGQKHDGRCGLRLLNLGNRRQARSPASSRCVAAFLRVQSVLRVEGLTKRYREVTALAGLSLEVGRGEVFGFLGANGAGKTTFTKCVTGFVRPTAGSIHVLDQDAVANPTKIAPHVGLVPDQYDFYSNLTGRQHLDFYGRLHGMTPEERKNRIAEVLDIVRMHERADSRVKSYSHGMKQRICIGQAILHKPEVIFFDEPTNGLDPKGAYELREMIRNLSRDGTTVFLSSHILSEVEQVCTRVAIVVRGAVKAKGTLAQLRALRGHAQGAARIRVLNPSKRIEAALQKAGLASKSDGDTLIVPGTEEETARAVAIVAGAGGQVASVSHDGGSLESIFLGLTEEGA